MAKGKEIVLPKLPRGMGGYSWNDDTHTLIKYRKVINYKNEKKTISAYGKTISEVNSDMKDKEEEFKKSVDFNITRIKTGTLEEGINDWLNLYKTEELKGKSYDRVESTFLTHIAGSNIGKMQEQAITSDHIQMHMKNLHNKNTGGKLSYSSAKKVYELLNQYFKYKYIRQPYLNPMLTVTKPKKDEFTDNIVKEEFAIWDDDEMLKLSQIAALPYKNGSSGFKNGLGIVFVMWSFLRIGEAMALQWKDIDFKNETVNIYKQFSRIKNRDVSGGYKLVLTNTKYNSTRKFKICKMALEAIKEFKHRKNVISDEEYVFSSNINEVISHTSITTTYKLMVKAANLDENKHVTIHGLRHSGISYMLRHGVPIEVVSKMAGHRSIQITLETYYSVIEKQKNDAITKLNEENYIEFINVEK